MTTQKIINTCARAILYLFLTIAIGLIAHHYATRNYDLKTLTGMSVNTENKSYPDVLEQQVLKALSFFPELEVIPIEFKFKKNIKKSTMQAQPRFTTLMKNRKKREYIILIKEKFTLGQVDEPIENLPNDVLVGWLGHELGHIMDYETMTNKELVAFGYNYFFSEDSIISAERMADRFAIKHGMKDYILKTKDFILNNADIPEDYKKRIKKFYLSPEEIMQLLD